MANQINVIATTQEVKKLEKLCYSNIEACEDFVRTTNADHTSLPLIRWTTAETQMLIELKLANAQVELKRTNLEFLLNTKVG
jgi:hypothetical protein